MTPVSRLRSPKPVLPVSLEHDTVTDQKTPRDPAVLPLQPPVACHLLLAGVNLRCVLHTLWMA